MRVTSELRVLLLIVGTLACVSPAQVVIDRIVAVVGNRVITLSDWEGQERFEALVNGRAPESSDFSQASLDRMVDLVLMQEQIAGSRFQHTTPEEASRQVLELRKQIPNAQSDEGWNKVLATYALSDEEFTNRVSAQMDVLRLMDLRFRPSVQVTSEQIESYYKTVFVPQFRRTGTSEDAIPPLKDVEEQIQKILTEEKVNEMVQVWLSSLRAQRKIKILNKTSKTSKTLEK
jgi:hypothetical protein